MIMSPLSRYNWMAAVMAAPGLSMGTRLLAARLALFVNLSDGRCDPSIATLAREVAMTTRGVEKALAILAEAGWITRTISRGRRSNSYALCLDRAASRSTEAHDATCATPNHGSGMELSTPNAHSGFNDATPNERAPTPEQNDAQPRTTVRTNSKRTEDKNRGEILPPPPRSHFSRPDEAPRPVAAESRSIASATPTSTPSPDAGFAEWWRVYPKREGETGARRAYERIVRSGEASPAELLAGAMRYAAGRQGEPERFTKSPENWLRGGHWSDPPSAAGNVLELRPARREWETFTDIARRKTDPEKLAAEIAMWGTKW